MGIRELKLKIQNKRKVDSLIIFRLPEDGNLFLANQYINAISEINNKDILYIENYDDLISSNIFDDEPKYIRVCKVDEFNSTNKNLLNVKNLIIITNKMTVSSENIFIDNITNIPKLEEWQIKSYVETLLKGANESNINEVFNAYKNNIDKLNTEITKVSIFPDDYKNYIINNLSINSSVNIFGLINGLVRREPNMVNDYLSSLGEIEPMGFLTLLYNNIKNIINIQLNSKATPQVLSMNTKQFNAIKYNIGHYNKEELINILEILTSADYKIKNNELPISMVVDFIITNILK